MKNTQKRPAKDPAFEALASCSGKIFEKALMTLETGVVFQNKEEYDNTKKELLNYTFSSNPEILIRFARFIKLVLKS